MVLATLLPVEKKASIFAKALANLQSNGMLGFTSRFQVSNLII
jgi:hypothetical protein